MMPILRKVALTALLALCSLAAFPLTTPTRTYDEAHPLVYEDSWDMWPYVFLNEQGQPDGFNVDLLRLLADELGLPYTIRLKPASVARRELREGRSDLMMGVKAPFNDSCGHYSQHTPLLFTHSVVCPKNQPVAVRTLYDLGRQPVIVSRESFTYQLMRENGWEANAQVSSDMKESLLLLGSEMKGQMVWNTQSLKWLLRQYHMDNVQIADVDMPHAEYRFIATDEQLLHMLDSVYTIASSSEQLQPIYNKWFYPERQETGIPSWVWLVAAAVAIVALMLIASNVVYHLREKAINREVNRHNARLAAVLQTSQVEMWTYDIARHTYTVMGKDGKPRQEYTAVAFGHFFRYDDFERLSEALRQLAAQEREELTLEMVSRQEEKTDAQAEPRHYQVALSVLRSEKGRPTVVLGTHADITDKLLKQRQVRDVVLKYQSIFSTAMVDMLFFDSNGILIDLNDKAYSTFQLDREALAQGRYTVSDIAGQDIDLSQMDDLHATQVISEGQKYYELLLVPVYDSQHRMLGIFGSGRDVSEVVSSYRKLQKGIRQVEQATKDVTDYISNINYVLKLGGVRMAKYSPRDHVLSIYSEMNRVQLQLTQSRCMTLVEEQSKKSAMRMLNAMDTSTFRSIDTELKTTLRSKNRHPLYLHFHFIPTYNADGQVESYFGLCRDVSEVKATEHQLELETEKAQEVETIKNAFLRNMSYEIRTPLNTVVGFAELFEQEHSAEDEDIFIKEIKDNSAYLLHLINDILFLSRLDARMIEINPQPVDFAVTFDNHCQMGWMHDQKEGVSYIAENPYEHLEVCIDDTNLGRVVEQIVQNAAQHTTTGWVRARYDYMVDKLAISVTDTGEGMDRESLDRIFERFASGGSNGTGLGLPICKELTQQMGGTLDITSQPGKGTTVWITLPCKATLAERKK